MNNLLSPAEWSIGCDKICGSLSSADDLFSRAFTLAEFSPNKSHFQCKNNVAPALGIPFCVVETCHTFWWCLWANTEVFILIFPLGFPIFLFPLGFPSFRWEIWLSQRDSPWESPHSPHLVPSRGLLTMGIRTCLVTLHDSVFALWFPRLRVPAPYEPVLQPPIKQSWLELEEHPK